MPRVCASPTAGSVLLGASRNGGEVRAVKRSARTSERLRQHRFQAFPMRDYLE